MRFGVRLFTVIAACGLSVATAAAAGALAAGLSVALAILVVAVYATSLAFQARTQPDQTQIAAFAAQVSRWLRPVLAVLLAFGGAFWVRRCCRVGMRGEYRGEARHSISIACKCQGSREHLTTLDDAFTTTASNEHFLRSVAKPSHMVTMVSRPRRRFAAMLLAVETALIAACFLVPLGTVVRQACAAVGPHFTPTHHR